HRLDQVELINDCQPLASNALDCPAGRTRSGKLKLERELIKNCDSRYHFFTNRTAGYWNLLDDATRKINDTNTFKKRIDKLLNLN
ncbi:hypothetical protein BpHYR1_033433, partial [Brachionus plicatilis]